LDSSRQSFIWASGIAALGAAVLLSVEAHGKESRALFVPPPELAGRPWCTVDDAAAAYRVWEAARTRGRRLVVLTGRWSRPRTLQDSPPTAEEPASGARGNAAGSAVDVNGAIYAATRQGIARRLDVVLPPVAYQQRRAEVSAQKDLELHDGAFLLPFEGLERRFSKPEAFRAPPEPVLLLVEPSWFQDGAPRPLPDWLEARGLSFDLALLALDDPRATDAQREEARRLGEALGAVHLETGE